MRICKTDTGAEILSRDGDITGFYTDEPSLKVYFNGHFKQSFASTTTIAELMETVKCWEAAMLLGL